MNIRPLGNKNKLCITVGLLVYWFSRLKALVVSGYGLPVLHASLIWFNPGPLDYQPSLARSATKGRSLKAVE